MRSQKKIKEMSENMVKLDWLLKSQALMKTGFYQDAPDKQAEILKLNMAIISELGTDFIEKHSDNIGAVAGKKQALKWVLGGNWE